MIAQDQELTGGVSSDIRIRQTDDGPIVVKRALDRLKVSADWRANPDRSHIEVRALRAAAVLIGNEHVPTVLWEDRSQHMFAMTLADPKLRNWKQELLAGVVDRTTAATVGDTLALLHLGSAQTSELAKEFDDQQSFWELRIDPFFLRVATKYPDLAPMIGKVVDAMARRRSVLVHGDFSPKNLLVRGEDVVVLDFEVAHWGDPAFDLGFCAAHMLLKAWRTAADEKALTEALAKLLTRYGERFGTGPLDDHLTRMTACLILARTDGDSPVDYQSELNIAQVRSAARSMLEMQGVGLLDAAAEVRRTPRT